jgi:hypothetical protein
MVAPVNLETSSTVVETQYIASLLPAVKTAGYIGNAPIIVES